MSCRSPMRIQRQVGLPKAPVFGSFQPRVFFARTGIHIA
jgi:hypothetical protein